MKRQTPVTGCVCVCVCVCERERESVCVNVPSLPPELITVKKIDHSSHSFLNLINKFTQTCLGLLEKGFFLEKGILPCDHKS